MSGVFQVESTVGLIVYFVLLAVKIYALGSALMYSSAAYRRPASSPRRPGASSSAWAWR